MTKKEAIEKYNTKWWENATDKEILDFQVNESRLCMPFEIFQEALQRHFQGPILTHQIPLYTEEYKRRNRVKKG